MHISNVFFFLLINWFLICYATSCVQQQIWLQRAAALQYSLCGLLRRTVIKESLKLTIVPALFRDKKISKYDVNKTSSIIVALI